MTRAILVMFVCVLGLSACATTTGSPHATPRVLYTIDNVPDTAEICTRPDPPARWPACMPADAVKRMIRTRVSAHLELQP